MSEKGAAAYQTEPLNQPPYPAQSPPGYVPQLPQATAYPHPPAGAPNYAHPAPPPPYDANSNVIHGVQQPAVTTYVQVVTRPQVGPDPSAMMCPSCTKQVVTRLDYDSTTKTHIAAGLLCLFGKRTNSGCKRLEKCETIRFYFLVTSCRVEPWNLKCSMALEESDRFSYDA
ncbi:hypothetical protein AND_003559 [Anopheles darlingi]|uniref:Uncharacterized protein n=1 Tax=Anopheles darlingi TaxID=43151 RepID=W5JMZ4_ANODA|nr:hypothetical protein AND_003559 [Anopheles darlingi]